MKNKNTFIIYSLSCCSRWSRYPYSSGNHFKPTTEPYFFYTSISSLFLKCFYDFVIKKKKKEKKKIFLKIVGTKQFWFALITIIIIH